MVTGAAVPAHTTSHSVDLGLRREGSTWRWSLSGIHPYAHDRASCAHNGPWLLPLVLLVLLWSEVQSPPVWLGILAGQCHFRVRTQTHCLLHEMIFKPEFSCLVVVEGKEQHIEHRTMMWVSQSRGRVGAHHSLRSWACGAVLKSRLLGHNPLNSMDCPG